MSSRRGFLSEISWFQVAVSALAAVTAAWIASSLGVAGTLIGAAIGSSVVTISSAFYGRTLDKGKTLIVQTASGTVVQKAVADGDIAEAFDEVEVLQGSPVESAEVVAAEPRGLHWKTITATTVIVLAIALAAMGTYEAVSGSSFGHAGNARIGNPLGGSSGSSGDRDPDPHPTKTASVRTPTPRTPIATTPAPDVVPAPAPAPAATPAPTTTDPAPTAPPTPTVPAPTATPTTPAE